MLLWIIPIVYILGYVYIVREVLNNVKVQGLSKVYLIILLLTYPIALSVMGIHFVYEKLTA